MSNRKLGILQGNIRQYGMTFALGFIILLFGLITKGILFRPMNISNLVMQNSYIIILSIGMFFCILTGNVDLSVGSVVAFTGAMLGTFLVIMGMPVWLGILLVLILGVVIGAFQGFFIAILNVPPFIVTLAGMLIFRGLTLIVLAGQSLSPFPTSIQFIASGFILPDLKFLGLNVFVLLAGFVLSVLYVLSELGKRHSQKKFGFELTPLVFFIIKCVCVAVVIVLISFGLSAHNGMPFIFVILLLIVAIYSFIANKTIAGRHVYAVGGNVNAARLSGINTKSVMFWVYTNMGFISAITGIVVAARLNAAVPKAGNGFELDAIAACLIGACSASGGIGTAGGAVIGALVMGVLNNGMSIMGIGQDWQQVIKGFILLIAVTFDIYSKSKSQKR